MASVRAQDILAARMRTLRGSFKRRFFAKTKPAGEVRTGMVTACLEWTGARQSDGYGVTLANGKHAQAHRVAWEFERGTIPDGICVLHHCDNPLCVNVEHLFLGTRVDNNADRDAKGRLVVPRGDAHYARLHPDKLARGDRHGSRTHPESLPRGDLHPLRIHPERAARGERVGGAKLTEANVRRIFDLKHMGWTGVRLAAEFGVSKSSMSAILKRKTWAHVDLIGNQPGMGSHG